MHPMLRSIIPMVLVVLSAAQCPASPVVDSEVRICPTFDAAPGNQDSVSIAAGTNGYMAVWRDTRGGQSDIFACRLSATGTVIDQAAIAVCRYTAEQSNPAVAFNGTDYLVVWGDRRDGPQHIYGARVRPDGTVIDPEGICLSGTAGSQAFPKVAGGGRGWQVVWQDSRGGTQDIYGVRVNETGVLGRVSGIVTLANNNEESPDIAYNGSTYIVVWRDYRNIASSDADIYGCRVAVNGIRMAGDALISCNAAGTGGAAGMQSAPRICALGPNCMVVWEDYRGDGTTCDVYGTLVNSSAAPLTKNGIAIATGAGNQELPNVGYDGNRLLVAWRERSNRYVRGARMTASGSLLDGAGFNIYAGSAGSDGVHICGSNAGGFRVGWNNLSMVGSDVLLGWVPTSGTVTPSAGMVISLGQLDQSGYAVADNGTGYAVVWSQNVGGKQCIMGARVSYAGEVLTPVPVNITGSIYNGHQAEPSIAWNGSQYLLAWCGDETFVDTNLDIRGFRLNADLTPIDASPILICTAIEAQRIPHVSSNGANFLVVWEDSRNALAPNYFTDIYGAIVSAAGGVTALSGAVSMSIGNQTKPHATSDGTNYFAVWEDYRYGYPLVYGARVTAAGVPSPAAGIQMPATSTSQANPRVLYGGGNYLVAWSDGYRIAGCRVNASGAVVDTSGINIDSASTPKGRPSACWDGVKFQIVFEDYRSQLAGNSDVYYTTLSSAGVVGSTPATGLVNSLIAETSPRIFGNADYGTVFYNRAENYINSLCFVHLTEQSVPVVVGAISAAKMMASGTTVTLLGKVVTAVFSGGFYAEELDRSSGVRVLSSTAVYVGDVVDITGAIGTTDGERQITTGTVIAMGVAAEPTRPLAMRGDMLGGASICGIVPGLTGGRGANNLGLLVKTLGTVKSLAAGYFDIECSAGISVRVKSGTLIQPRVGDQITVVGVSTSEVIAGALRRAILPRTQQDIKIVLAAP